MIGHSKDFGFSERAHSGLDAAIVWCGGGVAAQETRKTNNEIPNGGVVCCKSPKSHPLPNR
eukprot:6744320-Prymnesium_polylepis.1